MSVPTSALTDPVLLKSNGIPMYNFAVVIDDYDMKITHVLRGEEHLSNTPYQIVIKQALGFGEQAIEYGHLSIIVDETGKKLSKRNETLKQFIEDYKQMGFMPEAVTNFLALLGWSPFDNAEIMNTEDIVKQFDNKHISKAPAFFDIKKMMWISNEYFKKEHDRGFINFVKPFLTFDAKHFGNKLNDVLLIFKPQISYAAQLNDLVNQTFLSTDFTSISKESKTYLKTDNFQKCLDALHEELTNTAEITIDNATQIIEHIKTKTWLKGKDLFFPIRFAAIGKEHGPEMNKILYIVGRDEILKNIKTLKSI
ncbi:hypothetical protein FACS1894166_09510 [Bacilli bacterium]|nr:hypothetical protein FACS1894166_09510 [Bacilli bacterium]